MVDLYEEIVPGTSAAGFTVGQLYVADEFGNFTLWDRFDGPLGAAIATTVGWLRVDLDKIAPRGSGGFEFHYRNGTVKLQFSSTGVLYNICVFSGYFGKYADKIAIGDKLDKVLDYIDLSYDSHDELHYPSHDDNVSGIAFIASCVPLEVEPAQIILGITVHNWSLMRI